MYPTIKMITEILYVIFAVISVCGFCMWIITFLRHRDDRERRKKFAALTVCSFILSAACFLGYFVTAVRQYAFDLEKLPNFEVHSDSLENGEWKAVITNTDRGENLTPELSWNPVDHADRYAVVMIDESAAWLHWVAADLTVTELKEGQDFGDLGDAYSEYVGPYPPSGTHTYAIYVFALKNAGYAPSLNVDTSGADIADIAETFNHSPDSDSDNIIAYGKISGTYKK